MPRWNLLVVGIVCAVVAGSTVHALYLMQPIYQSLNAEVPLQSILVDWGFVALFTILALAMWWFWWVLRNEAGQAKYTDAARKFMYVTMAVIGLIGIGLITTSLLLPIYSLLGNF